MKRVQVTAGGLADALRRMGEAYPKAVEQGMAEAALMLKGALVQREIATTDPKPVDQGQYKAGWVSTPIEGGAVVGNQSKQALWIERGRGPGPVPFQAIYEWVKRKGFARKQAKATAKAQGRRSSKNEVEQAEKSAALAIQRKIEQQGIEPRWVLRRAMEALKDKMPGILRRALREVQA